MSVLKLKPECKNYLWGGNKLREKYNIVSDKSPLAESWMLSTHKDGESIIINGSESGVSLSDFIKKYGNEVLGSNCGKFSDFPVLIKLIDAKENLSIQVHPSNDYALKNENQFGKTEMWYILEAEPDAFLYYGFKRTVSESEFKERIENNTLTQVLNAVSVKKGDVFFIPSGTIHAIGKGIVIAEIQQNSNVTYRVYDYDRVGADGKRRELHIEKAIDVTDRCPVINNYDFEGHLAKCDYFTVDIVKGNCSGICDKTSFISLLVIDGTGVLQCENEELPIVKGDSLFLPAGSGEWQIHGDTEVIITRV